MLGKFSVRHWHIETDEEEEEGEDEEEKFY